MSDDEIPDPLAALDQLLATVADVAKVVGAYYHALREQGFTDVQALELTVVYQLAILRGTQ